MLLVCVTGPVGSGKTSLLMQLAVWYNQQHKAADGFIAIGENRSEPNSGAKSYRLRIISTGEELLYATRDESGSVPYKFESKSELILQEWAKELKDKVAPPLIILDEFGKREILGKGHALLWDSIKAAKPQIVVIAVRSTLISEIEKIIGAQFDVCVNVNEKGAWDKLRTVCAEQGDWKRIGVYGGAAGAFEASVGAMLHTAQIPFRGIALSSVQSVVMTFAGDGLGTRGRVVWVPFISAGIKALSPSGDRLNPMLAISMQGILYTFVTQLLGWNVIGVAIGGFLVGAWAAAQGVILQYLFVGNDLFRFYDIVIHWVADKLHLPPFGLFGLLLIWSSIAGAISSSVTMIAYKRRQRIPSSLQKIISQRALIPVSTGAKRTWSNIIKRSLRDLTRPYFWLPITIIVIFILVTGSTIEKVFWIVMRALAIAFVIFSLARSFEPLTFLNWLRKRGYWGPAYAFRLVFLNIGDSKVKR